LLDRSAFFVHIQTRRWFRYPAADEVLMVYLALNIAEHTIAQLSVAMSRAQLKFKKRKAAPRPSGRMGVQSTLK